MILEISPESPPIVHIAAAGVLYVHIGAGLVALLAGAGALVFRKGSRLHRVNGDVFVVSMLIMASIGAAVSPFLSPPQWANVVAGVFTLYLVISGWSASRRQARPDALDKLLLGIGVVIAFGAVAVGVSVMNAAEEHVASDSGPAFAFAAIVSLAVVGDVRFIFRDSISTMQRTVRHLWRMCFALMVATASLFLGQQQLFPEQTRGALLVPVVTVLALMTYWMVRTRFAKRRDVAAHVAS